MEKTALLLFIIGNIKNIENLPKVTGIHCYNEIMKVDVTDKGGMKYLHRRYEQMAISKSHQELFELEIKTISNAKKNILENFLILLSYKYMYDFGGFPEFPELGEHLSRVGAPPFWDKSYFISFCIYRLSRKLDNEEVKNYECDCCEGVTELYKTAYSWLKDFTCEPLPETTVKYQLCHINKNILFKGDTMTSVFTPLKEYIKLKSGVQCTSSTTEDWEWYWLKNIWNIDISISASNFIKLGYSFANFIPVPQGFNAGRSNFGKWDSWDLTLNQIYQWYLDNPQINECPNNRALEELFKCSENKDEAIAYCVEWLKMFHSWKDFVEQNYMQSFLLPDGCPKRFFKNHTLEYGLPKTLDEYEEFFENVVSCIEERGNAINKDIF